MDTPPHLYVGRQYVTSLDPLLFETEYVYLNRGISLSAIITLMVRVRMRW